MCRKKEGPPFHSVLTPSVPPFSNQSYFNLQELITVCGTSIALQTRKSKFLKKCISVGSPEEQ